MELDETKLMMSQITEIFLTENPHWRNCCLMGQALWRLPPRQQQQLQEELADRLADQEAGQEQDHAGILSHFKYDSESSVVLGRDGGPQRRAPQQCYGPDIYHLLRTRIGGKERHGFIDLEMLPPELGITILSYLNATDLCLAGCVWQDLGNDEYLWQGRLYLQLDEGCLTFNANAQEVSLAHLNIPVPHSFFNGISYFMFKGILVDHPKELAKFIFYTRRLNWKTLRVYLDERRDVLDELVTLHNFSNQFLPNALRDFFRHIHAPRRGESIWRPSSQVQPQILLILLSIDLTSPHVKNKMSKREFIRNTRRAAHNVSDDFVGHLYDNIYLIGHVAA
ncbi:hypothetical protein F7725_005149 [Dissostichus mawsoni]|uniref:SEC7 domain-containing protein n=1 Tax=Dissostichus mawsoni TaxID=36200 RepID=A0A7J5YQF1_DISMA|nr:hypothetical protein F7725_005149 [Dissostichus mawsoni]